MISGDSPCCWNFGGDEVGIRLWFGALLLLLDLVLVAALSCLILFYWSPCCRLAPTSWQPCPSSWSTPGALLSDQGGWSVLLDYLWWCLGVVLGVLERRWREKCCLWCVRLPLWCLSTTSAQSPLDFLTLWSKLRLWCLSLFGHYLWLPTGLSDLANGLGVAMIRI
jgi:hypothetical protein